MVPACLHAYTWIRTGTCAHACTGASVGQGQRFIHGYGGLDCVKSLGCWFQSGYFPWLYLTGPCSTWFDHRLSSTVLSSSSAS